MKPEFPAETATVAENNTATVTEDNSAAVAERFRRESQDETRIPERGWNQPVPSENDPLGFRALVNGLDPLDKCLPHIRLNTDEEVFEIAACVLTRHLNVPKPPTNKGG